MFKRQHSYLLASGDIAGFLLYLKNETIAILPSIYGIEERPRSEGQNEAAHYAF